MKLWAPKLEAFLRFSSIFLLLMTSLLIGLDSETKSVVYMEKKVTCKDLKALLVLVYVDAVAAAYNLLQLSRCFKASYKSEASYRSVAWSCFLLDQIVVYITFAATAAAIEHSVLVVVGANAFQWMKWCNRFTRFCFQIGGSLFCSVTACALMVFISSISAFNLFRLYSPNQFLLLKST
ncbi:hypothetical protein JCGZ_08683 [Jatropha curcas]|uniref:CASP-like protein n=1 Tax=Jatropha curcas TaxID=180498 RepID=A0A067KX28_JATCU|nr:CASP-like protein 2C1 [Jatropha curcas]KDP36414.1 hypothetical protein JCGZ_08683 [Jatropha curcas]